MNQLDMRGRTAVVTGGASGIGLAIAQRLAASGADVSIWDLNPDAMAVAAATLTGGGRTHTAKVDVTQLADIDAALASTIAALGKVDAVVNSAGIAGPNAQVVDYPIDDWKRIFDINVHGTFMVCRAVAKHMLGHGYGRIVNIASVAGKEGNPTASAYSASKAAVIGFTKSLGKELAKNNITVNCVTPAAVKTPIFDQVAQFHIDFMLSKIPMGRFGLVEEIAAMVAWMCTEECSFTTGGVFDLSGGRATY
ncbi:MAG: SDR family oxidoreductase [Burkholderiales bacterium]|jgi:3-oxoacyl-[acyl-carrier protein] reductase|nr:SDR family oxidoreductase [Burkholderiales bacterium]